MSVADTIFVEALATLPRWLQYLGEQRTFYEQQKRRMASKAVAGGVPSAGASVAVSAPPAPVSPSLPPPPMPAPGDDW